MANKDKEAWDASKRSTTPPPPEQGEHAKPCSACGGSGLVWQVTLNRATDSYDPCETTCPGCGGSGTG